ncbi:MAG: rhodanese-like domain-containing protein [Armatimonadota bacterium]
MHRSGRILTVICGFVALAVMLGCSGSSEPAPRSTTVQTVSPAELEALVDGPEPPVVLDVRTAAEFEAGYIPGSVNIPLDELAQRLAELDPNVPVACVCATGYRSVEAAELLVAEGFSPVLHLDGGVRGWTGEWEPDCPTCG